MEILGQFIGALGGIAAAVVAGIFARRERAVLKAINASTMVSTRLVKAIEDLSHSHDVREAEAAPMKQMTAKKIDEIHAEVRDGKARCLLCESTVEKIDRAAERILEGRVAG